ncbi:polyhydroxyalkanoic acid system family protein [Methylocapsa acidiphila]|uniref:polyhydroxyalkanoic acid system family protein n=1 Tax=Methylocapsa acidiphila TaxID=133552 RepID=UPI0004038962|nr:polyhydroxyalkanoic acid system family protein [Methylocapsa acidiphila]
MSKSIVVTVPHDLGLEKAKKRVSERIELLRRDYIDKLAYSEVAWTGDKADVRVVAFGQTVTAQLDVKPDSLRIEVQLPWVFALLADKIQGTLKSNAQDTLQIGHTPKT